MHKKSDTCYCSPLQFFPRKNVEFVASCGPEMNAYGSMDLHAFYQTLIYIPALSYCGRIIKCCRILNTFIHIYIQADFTVDLDRNVITTFGE
jgi:hypothetical protein